MVHSTIVGYSIYDSTQSYINGNERGARNYPGIIVGGAEVEPGDEASIVSMLAWHDLGLLDS